MDVTDVLRRLVRRRIAVLGVLVLALVVAAVGWKTAGASRQSVAAVVIVPPTAGQDPNPLLDLDNNLAQLATVLASALQSPTVVQALDRAGATAAYTISTVTGTNPSYAQLSPQLVFTVTGSDALVTQRTAGDLVVQARAELADLQDQTRVTPANRVTVIEVVAPTAGETVGSGRLRAAGSLGLGILVGGLLLILLVDEVMGRRRHRGPARHRRAHPAPAGAASRPPVFVNPPVAGTAPAGQVHPRGGAIDP